MNSTLNTKHFLCIDVGTTRYKAAIVTSTGDIIIKYSHYYSDLSKIREQDLHFYKKEDFYNAFKTSLTEIRKNFNLNTLSAIGITGHGQTLVPIGYNGKVLYNILGFLDKRIAEYNETVKRTTNKDTISMMYIPTALFYKNEQFDIYKKVMAFLTSFDYISFLLTDRIFTSVSSPDINPWGKNTLLKFNLDPSKFPPFVYLGQKIGLTTYKAEKEFGIPYNIPVYAMGGDYSMGVLGTGTVEKGKAYLRFGTSAGINLCWDKKITDKRLLSYRHFIKPFWNISAIINAAGVTIDWVNNILRLKKPPEILNKSTAELLFFPYLKGEKTPLWDPNITASLIGIKSRITKKELFSSTLTGIFMALREGIELIENSNARFIKPIAISGWWAQNERFVNLLSNVTGKTFVTTQNNDAELLGIAIVLSKVIGVYPDIKSSAQNIVKIRKIFNPSLEVKDYYNNIYKKFILIRNKIYA